MKKKQKPNLWKQKFIQFFISLTQNSLNHAGLRTLLIPISISTPLLQSPLTSSSTTTTKKFGSMSVKLQKKKKKTTLIFN
jgi:hypothetical protein